MFAAIRFLLLPWCGTLGGAISSVGPLQEDLLLGNKRFPSQPLDQSHSEREARAADSTAANWTQLETFIERVMAANKIPATAITVVMGEEVLYVKTFGVADVENAVPATEDTLFHIASLTKSFTAALLALSLNDAGLSLDTQVRDILPEFSMMNEFATAATVRDILTHVTGLSRHESVWSYNPDWMPRADIARQLKYLAPEVAFRYEPRYNNWMYAIAGRLAEVLAGGGATWESLMRDRLFHVDALGMNSTMAGGIEEAIRTGNYAMPYLFNNGESAEALPKLVDKVVESAVAPAGAILSTAKDMAKYMQMHLMDGVVDGRRVISQEWMKKLHTGTVVFPEGSYTPGALYSITYGGKPALWHDGAMSGSNSLMVLPKGYGIGVSVMANMGGVTSSLLQMIEVAVSIAIGQPPTLSVEDARFDLATAGIVEVASPLSLGRTEGQMESSRRLQQPFAELAGEYRHPFYGWLNVTADSMTYGNLVCTGCYPDCNGDWFTATACDVLNGQSIPGMPVHTERNITGGVVGLAFVVEPSMPAITFSSQDYTVEAEEGWPRHQPLGEGRPVLFAGSSSQPELPSPPQPPQTPGFSTAQVIVISVVVAWAVPVFGAGVLHLQRMQQRDDDGGARGDAPSQGSQVELPLAA